VFLTLHLRLYIYNPTHSFTSNLIHIRSNECFVVQTRYGSCQEATAQGCWEATDTSRYYILIKSFRIEIMDCVQFPVFLATRRLVAWTKATLALMRNWKLELIERTARCAVTHWSRVPVASLPVYTCIYTRNAKPRHSSSVNMIWTAGTWLKVCSRHVKWTELTATCRPGYTRRVHWSRAS